MTGPSADVDVKRVGVKMGGPSLLLVPLSSLFSNLQQKYAFLLVLTDSVSLFPGVLAFLTSALLLFARVCYPLPTVSYTQTEDIATITTDLFTHSLFRKHDLDTRPVSYTRVPFSSLLYIFC